jgi:hypothetical protein
VACKMKDRLNKTGHCNGAVFKKVAIEKGSTGIDFMNLVRKLLDKFAS